MSEFNWTPDELAELVNTNRLVLFMKGTPEMPQCGFSNRAAQVLRSLNEPFVSVNILTDPRANNNNDENNKKRNALCDGGAKCISLFQ